MLKKTVDFHLDLTGARFGFRVRDSRLLAALKRRYRPFTVAGRSPVVIDVETTRPAKDRQVRPFRPTIEADGSRFSFKRGDACFELDRKRNSGSLRVWGNPYSFDAALRVAYSGLLSESSRGGFLLHAAAVKDRSGVLLFPGISGAGKSTLARSLGFKSVLSDELVGIRPWREGFQGYSTPFWGNGKPPRAKLAGPVRGIFFLQKAKTPGRTRLSAMHSQRRAMRCLLWFPGQDPVLLQRAWEQVIRLTRTVPCFRLAFDKRKSPLPMLREALK